MTPTSGKQMKDLCFGAALLAPLLYGSTPAFAGCNNRPGTPNPLSVRALSSSALEFTWQNTTGRAILEPTMYFDMYLQTGGHSIGQDRTGDGPYDVSYHSTSKTSFGNLQPNTNYCFAMRARGGKGTSGCVSEKTSNWICGTTLAVGAKPVQQANAQSPAGPPTIRVAGQPGNLFNVTGSGFQSNASVQVRVADQSLRSIPFLNNEGSAIKADGSGQLKQSFHGLCQRPGTLFFSATDGRPNKADMTGFLWSNTIQATCSN